MKIKFLNALLLINFLTILLFLAIWLLPDNSTRVVLGLPFLLFFPGYALMATLFPKRNDDSSRIAEDNKQTHETNDNGEIKEAVRKRTIDGIERIVLSFGMSIAVTALLGLGLNFTPWGISLIMVIIAIAAFIFVMSAVAMIRQHRTRQGLKLTSIHLLKIPGWEGSVFNKSLTVVLTIAVLGSIATLGYIIIKPKVGERFSEFYILGNTGKAENYPSGFLLSNGAVSKVNYGTSIVPTNSTEGKITLGIVNQEQKETIYSVALQIDGQAAAINDNGTRVNRLENIKLQQGEKWEHEIGFAPQHIGDKQKVELFLYKNDSETAKESLHIWVNVTGN